MSDTININNNLSFLYKNNIYNFDIQGESFWGGDYCMLDNDVNLLSNTSFKDTGFMPIDFLDREMRNDLRHGIGIYINRLLDASFITDFSKYHEFVDDNVHLALTSKLVGIPISDFPINPEIIIAFLSDFLKQKLALQPSHSKELKPHFCLRIVRPNFRDNNPLHRDVWIDRLRNAVNIFFPITMPYENSNLGLIPGSHLWNESEIKRTKSGALVNGTKYSVPTVVETKHELCFQRPSLKNTQALIFSPYLIHGAAINFTQMTRVSLEMRFWKK